MLHPELDSLFKFTHTDLLGTKRTFLASTVLYAEQQLRFELHTVKKIAFNSALRIIYSGEWSQQKIAA